MKTKMRLTVIFLSLMLLLCACKKTEGNSSKPDATGSDNPSYSDGVSSDNISSDDVISDVDFDFSSDFEDTSEGDSSDNESDDEEEEDEDENNLYAIHTSKYEITSTNDPVKALTGKEMMDKCIKENLAVKETVLNVGLEKSVKIARITDMHLAFVNGADNAVAREQASIRYKYFTDADKKLQRCVNYVNALGVDMVAFTGDILDFFSVGNLEKFKTATSVLDDFMFSMGNHDDVFVVGGGLPTETERNSIHKFMKSYVKGDLSFDTRQVGEITVITMDNSKYTFSQSQLDKMKAEIAKGRPMLLMMHVPLYTEALYAKASQDNEQGSIMPSVARATGTTKEMLELIHNNSNLIKGIFAGHMHYDFVSDLDCGGGKKITQYMMGVSYSGGGTVEVITVK